MTASTPDPTTAPPLAPGRAKPVAASGSGRTQASRRTHEERRTATREALLSAAIEVITESGYASTTTNLIAKRAGVTRGALQYHFATREEMVVAVIDHVMVELNFRIDTSGLASMPLSKRVEALIARYRAVFAGPLFTATMQILLGVRNDPVVFAKVREHLTLKQDAINHTWEEIFPDVRLEKREMASLRRMAMAAIRGYVLLEAFGYPGTWNKDAVMLCRMVTSNLPHDPAKPP